MAISKITLNGVTQIDLTSDTVTASKLFDDYTAHGADGTVVTGSYVAPTARTSSDVTVSGATVTIPSGAYSTQVQKSVASGTAGTPTASKSVDTSTATATVTPSVTNTTGYITGSTKTGTAVTVTASELVDGNSATADDYGAWNVTDLETLTIPQGTAGTPSATKGSVSNHSISVTPSVTNSEGWISSGTKTGTAVTVTASELASGNKSITENGENIDVVGYSTVSVDVQSSGGSDYTYIGSTEFTVNTSSTTAITVGTFQTGDTSIWTSAKMLFIKIRDKAGRRDGYYYGSDAVIYNTGPGNGATWTTTANIYGGYYRQASGLLYMPACYYKQSGIGSISGYGIYPTVLTDTGDISFSAKYTSSSGLQTSTIDGTFVVEVYTLKFPNDVTPFDDDYS